jgi:hypothetical protein
MRSSTLGRIGSSPNTALELANTMRGTPASRAATSMLRKPLTLLSCVSSGRSIERGTLPSAAWCSTRSTPLQASRQVSSERMSPSMKRTPSGTLSRLPVEKLSSPTTFWPSSSSFTARLEPMKPATPVTSQVRRSALMRCCTSA